MKKIICLLCVITLTMGSVSIASAATWNSYFGLNKGWYEGTKGTLSSNTETGWTAKISDIGWGGVWGGQVYKKEKTEKGKKYTIKFNIQSSKLDKYIWVKIGNVDGSKINYAKWIDCRKGKTISINDKFTAKYNIDSIYFGFGGDYGDRANVKSDKDAKVRYKYAPNSKLDMRLGVDAAAEHPTVITCSNFSLKGSGIKFESPKMSNGFIVMDKGQKTTIKLTGTKKKAKWYASNKKLVKITKKGKNKIKVKALKTGNTTIIAKIKKKKYKCRIAIF